MIFLAVGAHGSIRLPISGIDETKGILDAIDFLRDVNLGDWACPGRRVVIVGGGNVAIDAARVAKRLGAESVTVVYRRTAQEMPAYADEIEGALEEGIEIHYLTAPVSIIADKGRVAGLECIRTALGEPDESGRRRPVPVEDSQFTIHCDTVIPAIGQRTDTTWAANLTGLEWTRRQTLKINPPPAKPVLRICLPAVMSSPVRQRSLRLWPMGTKLLKLSIVISGMKIWKPMRRKRPNARHPAKTGPIFPPAWPLKPATNRHYWIPARESAALTK